MKMKRTNVWVLLAVAALPAISWGVKGHNTVALIGQKHLTSKAAADVTAILRGESVEEASTWPDEHRTPETAPWHYINLPLGLSRSEFEDTVKARTNNVYTAILSAEATLKNTAASLDEKRDALRYLIHFIGDVHQPMHVSRKEDKGGNAIQVRMDEKGTNLHSLWDGKLIDHEGLTTAQMVPEYDKATAKEIKQWQKDDLMEWMWESYQLATQIYQETSSGQTISEEYYKKYITVIHKRVEQAGIRLAGALNDALSK